MNLDLSLCVKGLSVRSWSKDQS